MPEEDENTCAIKLFYKYPPAETVEEEEEDDGVFLPPKLPEEGPLKTPLSPIVETSR